MPVDFAKQVLPGTFEHALAHPIDHKLDCSAFDARYSNDAIVTLFREVPVVCNDVGLIGHERFAIDAVNLPSNASKEWSGRRVDFEKKLAKGGTAAKEIVRRHRQRDKQEREQDGDDGDQRSRKKLEANADKLRDWLSSHADVVSKRGYEKTQNITGPDSAKMKTSRGVIQGYTGAAAVDDRDQVIVYAEAFGEGQEQSTLPPVIDGLGNHLDGINATLTGKRITADAGYHSEANVELLHTQQIDGYLADTGMRKRDPAQSKYRQVVFFSGETQSIKWAPLMQQKIDSAEGRRLYGRRLGTVEPVFVHLRTHERFDRFTLRSKPKVNGQWLLYCLVQNNTKLMKVPEIGYSTS